MDRTRLGQGEKASRMRDLGRRVRASDSEGGRYRLKIEVPGWEGDKAIRRFVSVLRERGIECEVEWLAPTRSQEITPAMEFLVDYLEDRTTPVPWRIIVEGGGRKGHSESSLRRARGRLGMVKSGEGRNTCWSLPPVHGEVSTLDELLDERSGGPAASSFQRLLQDLEHMSASGEGRAGQ